MYGERMTTQRVLPHHTHECRDCGDSIECFQTDEECDRDGGIGQYNRACDECRELDRVSHLTGAGVAR